MKDVAGALELEDERTAQKRYAKKLQEQALRRTPVQVSRNNLWTGTGLPRDREFPIGQLVGRVALVGPHDYLDDNSDFYVGERHADLDGIEVCSWAAPIACTFFRGSKHHELCPEVAVIRSFVHQNDQIVAFADEVVRHDAPPSPFHKRGLAVPAPPTMPSRPLNAGPPRPPSKPRTEPAAILGAAPEMFECDTEDVPSPKADKLTLQMGTRKPANPHRDHAPQGEKLRPVRAEALLRTVLEAPRTRSLMPVLSTLQPDQYELVTLPAMSAIIVEGQPGTGKTIVASHRAAYLINDETPPENTLDGNVLVVGPTPAYSSHIRDIVSRLSGDSERIRVLSLPEIMQHILGLRDEPVGATSRTWQDVDLHLGIVARSAIQRLRVLAGVTPTSEQVWDHLRRKVAAPPPNVIEAEWHSYLQSLPSFKDALRRRAHEPLLALIRWEVAPPRDMSSIEHIIVDEAQDVTALEWLLLQAINETDAWTLLGDLNQRRSDHTLASWNLVIDALGLPKGHFVTHRLHRGYRSTKPILEFANKLLPRTERPLTAFQESGPSPRVVQSRPLKVSEAVSDEVDRLLSSQQAGSVAVITTDLPLARSSLRAAGWSTTRTNLHAWERAGRSVVVVHPDLARGLEFDAVLVLEPADFPQNYGRHGPLYTALTRPNRELTVLHFKPLPEPLRRR